MAIKGFPKGTDIRTHRFLAYNLDQVNSFLPRIYFESNGLHQYNREKILKGLLLYLAKAETIDIWNFIEIDTKKLSQEFIGVDVSNLHRNLEEPYQKKEIRLRLEESGLKGAKLEQELEARIRELKESKTEYYFESVLEDILYRMQSVPLKLKMKSVDANSTTYDTENNLLIKNIRVSVDNSRKGKIRYFIRPTNFYFDSLNRSWVFQNSESARKLLKKNKNDTRLYDLYTFIVSLKEDCRKKNLACQPANFDFLCNIASVTEYKAEKRKKNKLIEMLKVIVETSEHLDDMIVNWDYKSEESNYRYQPIFYFDARKHQGNYVEQKEWFLEKTYTTFLFYLFEDHYPDVLTLESRRQGFQQWLSDTRTDLPHKCEVAKKAVKCVYDLDLEATDPAIVSYVETGNPYKLNVKAGYHKMVS